jgi:phosphate transport system permease protein
MKAAQSRAKSALYLSLAKRDKWLVFCLSVLASIPALILALIIGFLIQQAWPVLESGGLLQFFNHTDWYPLEGKLGLLSMLLASVAVTIGALLIALPLGLAAAVFIEFYAPAYLTKPFAMMVTILAGIPSVVFGLWGITVLVPIIVIWQPPGVSLFTAMLVLSLMILPTITLTTTSALSALPNHLHQGAAALSLSRYSTIIQLLFPAAWSGIVSGILLAIVRALGETMAVLMVAGNVVQVPQSLFDPVRVLTANIALEMAYATDNHRAALFASALLLMLLVLVIAWGAAHLEKENKALIYHA